MLLSSNQVNVAVLPGTQSYYLLSIRDQNLVNVGKLKTHHGSHLKDLMRVNIVSQPRIQAN